MAASIQYQISGFFDYVRKGYIKETIAIIMLGMAGGGTAVADNLYDLQIRYNQVTETLRAKRFGSIYAITQEYAKNPELAQGIYSGKWVQTYGVVEKIEKNEQERFTLNLTDEKTRSTRITVELSAYQFHSLNAKTEFIATETKTEIGSLKTYEAVILNCHVQGSNKDNVTYKECLYWDHPTYKKIYIRKQHEPVTPAKI